MSNLESMSGEDLLAMAGDMMIEQVKLPVYLFLCAFEWGYNSQQSRITSKYPINF